MSPENDELLARAVRDDEADHVVGVPGGRDRLDPEAASLQRSGDDGQPELGFVHDMVEVRMGAQDVRRRQLVLADEGLERLHRAA